MAQSDGPTLYDVIGRLASSGAEKLDQGIKGAAGTADRPMSPAYGPGAASPASTTSPSPPASAPAPPSISDSAVGATDIPSVTAPAPTAPPTAATPPAPSATAPSVAPVAPASTTAPAGSLGGSILPSEAQEAARRNPANAPTVKDPAAYSWQVAKNDGFDTFMPTTETGSPATGAVATKVGDNPGEREARIMGNAGGGTIQRGTGLDDASLFPGARTGQIFAGSANDAEAARNLQARFEQDAAASQMVASMNKGAEAERDLRAAKLGVDRGTLDQMEGRATAATGSGSATSAPSLGSLWDRPGDGFGDAQMRQAKYESLVNDAANDRGFGARRRGERKLAAAQAMLTPGLDTLKAQQADLASRNSLAGQLASSQASLAGQRYSADASLAGKQLDAEASLAGSRLTAQQQAEKNRIDEVDLAIKATDADTRQKALTQKPQTGTDLLAQERINLIRALGDPKTTDEQRKAIREQLMFFGGQPDPATMAMSAAEKQEKP